MRKPARSEAITAAVEKAVALRQRLLQPLPWKELVALYCERSAGRRRPPRRFADSFHLLNARWRDGVIEAAIILLNNCPLVSRGSLATNSAHGQFNNTEHGFYY